MDEGLGGARSRAGLGKTFLFGEQLEYCSGLTDPLSICPPLEPDDESGYDVLAKPPRTSEDEDDDNEHLQRRV